MAGQGQAHYTGDRVAIFENELAEILVFGDENATFGDSTGYNILVRRSRHGSGRAEYVVGSRL